ncbi:MAG: intradiol ring-cleavage dioxygenase [Ilumatobacteraceae bacterium]
MNTTHELHEHDEDHDRGLGFDLPTLMNRRRIFQLAAGAGLLALVGCGSTTSTSSPIAQSTAASTSGSNPTAGTTAASTASSATMADTSAASGSLTEIPEETAGPYPGDGSNGVNVLTESGIVRSNIRSSFGSSTTTAAGIPTTVTLTVLDVDTGAAVSGAAVYLWHCNIAGEYSMYSNDIKDENYLRGVQVTDANGQVTFLSIYPACYSGRWPHIHYEVYPSVTDATAASNKLATSQLALPDASNQLVFATTGYEESVSNYAQTSQSTDNVFSDGATLETPTVTGDVTSGIAIALRLAVSTS